MNRKQLVILLVLVVLVGGAGLMLLRNQNKSWQGANPSLGKKLLGEFPVNDVAHITVKQGTNELNLAKTDNWRVRERNNYPANYSEISDFLIKVRDLKSVQNEKVGPSQLARLWLTPGPGTNAATVVDLKDQKDKSIKTLLLGKKHMKKSDRPSPYGEMGEEGWPDGRYVKLGDSDNATLISDALANIEPKPEQWLNKDFFKIEKVRLVAVTFPAATNSWKLTRDTETAEWKLAEAKPTEQLDNSKASGVANPLASPSFADVAVSVTPEGLDKPTVATVDTFDGFTYTLKVGQKTNDNYPLALAVAAQLPKERTAGKDEKPEDKAKLDKEFKEKQKKLEEKLAQEKTFEKWVYLVSSFTVDPLLKERSQLMVEKKEEPKKEEKPGTASTSKPDETKKEDQPPPAPEPAKKEEAPKPESLTPPPAEPKAGGK
jgi:hypothetical protein